MTTIFLGSLCTALFCYFFKADNTSFVESCFVLIILGFLLATPALFIHYLFFWIWMGKSVPASQQKLLSTIVAIGVTFLAFYLFGWTSVLPEGKTGYIIAIIISSFWLRPDSSANTHLENAGSK